MSSNTETRKYLAEELTKERLMANRVTLVVGYASKLVRQMMRRDYYTVTNIDEARSFVAKFSTPLDQVVVVGDLSLLDDRGQATFLKFIEEAYCPLLILASKDNVLETILSRCKKIIKVPVETKYSQVSLNKFISDRELEKLDFNDETNNFSLDYLEEESLLNCPDYFYIYKKYLENKSLKVINKYIKLL